MQELLRFLHIAQYFIEISFSVYYSGYDDRFIGIGYCVVNNVIIYNDLPDGNRRCEKFVLDDRPRFGKHSDRIDTLEDLF